MFAVIQFRIFSSPSNNWNEAVECEYCHHDKCCCCLLMYCAVLNGGRTPLNIPMCHYTIPYKTILSHHNTRHNIFPQTPPYDMALCPKWPVFFNQFSAKIVFAFFCSSSALYIYLDLRKKNRGLITEIFTENMVN